MLGLRAVIMMGPDPSVGHQDAIQLECKKFLLLA